MIEAFKTSLDEAFPKLIIKNGEKIDFRNKD